MSRHVAISPEEAADRLAIRELVEAYAHCADRRDAKGQMALFTADTERGCSRSVCLSRLDSCPSRCRRGEPTAPHRFADWPLVESLSWKKSPSTSTRLGRRPPGGVSQCTDPPLVLHSGNTISRRPSFRASLTINSGRIPRPTPAVSAGSKASPLLTRKGPCGRTVAVSPLALLKCQLPPGVEM